MVIAQLNGINNRRMIVGNAFGLTKRDYGALWRIDPVVWTCEFSN